VKNKKTSLLPFVYNHNTYILVDNFYIVILIVHLYYTQINLIVIVLSRYCWFHNNYLFAIFLFHVNSYHYITVFFYICYYCKLLINLGRYYKYNLKNYNNSCYTYQLASIFLVLLIYVIILITATNIEYINCISSSNSYLFYPTLTIDDLIF